MAPFQNLTKQELRQRAQSLHEADPAGLEQCLAFFEAETQGVWHNRARAMIARRLKHVSLTPPQQERLLLVILQRLRTGTFTEQFKDQLRLALHLDRDRVMTFAQTCTTSRQDHVCRYAAWILAHQPQSHN
jgi:hypothetical protein